MIFLLLPSYDNEVNKVAITATCLKISNLKLSTAESCTIFFSYPYNITKSSLSNVGAMSCWPTALGAMTWLANLAKVSLVCLKNAVIEHYCITMQRSLKGPCI